MNVAENAFSFTLVPSSGISAPILMKLSTFDDILARNSTATFIEAVKIDFTNILLYYARVLAELHHRME